jgi:hypothetical protein
MVKQFVRSSRYFSFALLVLFIGGEVVLRCAFGEHMLIKQYPLIYAPDTALGFRGIPNKAGHIRLPSIDKRFRLNRFGFYGQDFTLDHPDSIFRILIGGSSVVEGIWAQQKLAFPTMLDSLFKARGYKVEVINCAVSGLGRSWQDMNLLRESVVRFHANLALFERPFPITRLNYYREAYRGYSLLFTGNNEAERRLSQSIARRKADWLAANPIVTGVYDLSYCLREWIRQQGSNQLNTVIDRWHDYADNNPASWQNTEEKDMTVQESIYWLNDITAEMNRAGCQLVAFEYGNNEMSDRIRASEEVKFPYLSLELPLDGPEYHHALDEHFNYIGFTFIVTKLFDVLSRDYIPKAYWPKGAIAQQWRRNINLQ